LHAYPVSVIGNNGTKVDAYLVTDVTLTTDFWTISPAGNGILYSGGVPSVVWTAIPNFLNQSSVLSVNIKTTYITTPANGVGVTLSVVGSLPAGWTYTDGTGILAYDGSTVAGPATVNFSSVLSGLTSAPSDSFSVQGVGTPSGDSVAPTIPLGIAVTNNVVGTIALQGYTPSDPNQAGHTWSGLQQVNIVRTPPGSIIGHTTVGPGNQPTVALQDIGGASPASTFSQSGADVTLSTYGNGLYGTSDQFAFAPNQITAGSWVATCKISSFSSAYGFSYAGLMARTSLATNASHVSIVTCPFAGGGGAGINQRTRASTGATTTQTFFVNSASPIWLAIVYNGTTYSTYYSFDGNSFSQLGSSLATNLGTSPYVGPCLASNQAALQVSCVLQQFALQSLANWTYTDNTVASNTAYTYAASAQDSVPNVSAISNAIAVTSASAVAGAIKWHPGHYALSPGRPTNPSLSGFVHTLMTSMAQATNPATGLPGFSGWIGHYTWGRTETAQGVYDTTLIDDDLAYLAGLSTTYGKTFRLIIAMAFASYTTIPKSIPTVPQAYGTSDTVILPDYIISPGVSGLAGTTAAHSDCFFQAPGFGIMSAYWRPNVLARYNALIQYLGNKYDSNPNVEMFIPFEQTSATPTMTFGPSTPSPSDATFSALLNAQASMAQTTATYWPTTNKIIPNNYPTYNAPVAPWTSMCAANAALGIGMGAPDLPVTGAGGHSYIGTTYGMSVIFGAGGDFGTINYLGKIPIGFDQEQMAYKTLVAPDTGPGIAAIMEAYAYNTMKMTHMGWENDSTNNGATVTWAQTIAALAAQNYRIHSGCPTNYSACSA
jgi:hypothetical protein